MAIATAKKTEAKNAIVQQAAREAAQKAQAEAERKRAQADLLQDPLQDELQARTEGALAGGEPSVTRVASVESVATRMDRARQGMLSEEKHAGWGDLYDEDRVDRLPEVNPSMPTQDRVRAIERRQRTPGRIIAPRRSEEVPSADQAKGKAGAKGEGKGKALDTPS